MRSTPFLTLAALLLAACETDPPPYPVYSQPYVIPAPAIPSPEPPSYLPLPPAPPSLVPTDPAPGAPEIAEPLAPAIDPEAPRDPVEDVLLKPMSPPEDPPAQTFIPATTPRVETPSPPDTGSAVPLMGFRPMRGQKQPGA